MGNAGAGFDIAKGVAVTLLFAAFGVLLARRGSRGATSSPAFIPVKNSRVLSMTSEKEFEKKVLSSALPVLVEFYAHWCAPCRRMAPVVEAVAVATEGRFLVVRVDADAFQAVALRCELEKAPTFLIFRNGSIGARFSGVCGRRELLRRLTEVESERACPSPLPMPATPPASIAAQAAAEGGGQAEHRAFLIDGIA